MSAPKLTAYGYTRVSTPGQVEKTSPESQAAAIRKRASERDVDLVQIFNEQHTRSELWERQQLNLIRDAIRARKIQVLIIYALDRLSGDIAHLAILFDEAKRHGVEIWSCTENIDDTPEGKLLRAVRGYVAEVELEKIRERTIRGRRQRLLSGKVGNAGPELYGYRRDKERGVRLIEEGEALIVRRIFERLVNGDGLITIAKALNSEGVLSPYAAKGFGQYLWSATAIRNIIQNPAYKGEPQAWRWKGEKNGSNSSRPPSDWIPLPPETTPALVVSALWAAANARLAEHNPGDKVRNEKTPYLLRGHLICAKCGLRMYPMPKVEKSGQTYRYYRCSSVTRFYRQQAIEKCGASVVPADDCEAAIWREVEQLLRTPELVTQLFAQQSSAPATDQAELEITAARKALAKIEQGRARLLRRLRETDDDQIAKLIEGELKTLNTDAQQAQAALEVASARREQRAQATAQRQGLITFLKRTAKNLSKIDFEEKRQALTSLGVQVIADGRKWKVELSLPGDEIPLDALQKRTLKLFMEHIPPNPKAEAVPVKGKKK